MYMPSRVVLQFTGYDKKLGKIWLYLERTVTLFLLLDLFLILSTMVDLPLCLTKMLSW